MSRFPDEEWTSSDELAEKLNLFSTGEVVPTNGVAEGMVSIIEKLKSAGLLKDVSLSLVGPNRNRLLQIDSRTVPIDSLHEVLASERMNLCKILGPPTQQRLF